MAAGAATISEGTKLNTEPKAKIPSWYQEVLHDTGVLVMLAQGPAFDELDAAIEHAEHAMSVGPYLDPTLWMRAQANLSGHIKLLKAVKAFKAVITEIGDV